MIYYIQIPKDMSNLGHTKEIISTTGPWKVSSRLLEGDRRH